MSSATFFLRRRAPAFCGAAGDCLASAPTGGRLTSSTSRCFKKCSAPRLSPAQTAEKYSAMHSRSSSDDSLDFEKQFDRDYQQVLLETLGEGGLRRYRRAYDGMNKQPPLSS
ncbi:unnamed protein product [Vitrella brassicaformis CCMP3155]|uniref:Uncharacterized protein n=1 Tax=Vitrella brassicaformis (strain CCMP3155) TaxID=1169540 RepID=A0A0G4GL72_VITBC|nr:unnamed protein product [Vitrella brassicaformis CCMP3155]|eukprot:CEM30745.1 unnamed protein product [Vitrella brassicaformis CCMP3155]